MNFISVLIFVTCVPECSNGKEDTKIICTLQIRFIYNASHIVWSPKLMYVTINKADIVGNS